MRGIDGVTADDSRIVCSCQRDVAFPRSLQRRRQQARIIGRQWCGGPGRHGGAHRAQPGEEDALLLLMLAARGRLVSSKGARVGGASAAFSTRVAVIAAAPSSCWNG